jgi:DNA helicase-2/ATP-dependent DNA helicase PcrA
VPGEIVSNELLTALNPEQVQAVVHTEGPVLVLAGAGTGKTRVLTHRIAYLLGEKRVAPGEILAFTFTNKAAGEMRQRVTSLLGREERALWIGTFHATGVRILRREAERLGFSRRFAIYDEEDTLAVTRDAVQRLGVASERVSQRWIRERISRWKTSMVFPEAASEEAADAREREAARVYGEYERALRRADAFDFDDLITKVVLLFGRHPELRESYGRRFRYVLVDEFQDTNNIQMELIEELASAHRNLFAVGDDDQSIYAWRGASLENILGFDRIYPECRIIRLERNYRSPGIILRAGNALIAHNRGRRGKNLWTEREQGEPVRILTAVNEEEEGYGVVQIILSELQRGTARSEIVLLYRTNAQSRPLEDGLRRGNLPYQLVGGTRFYERREIRDVLAYLKILANPSDDVNLKRILNVPRRGLGERTLEKLQARAAARGVPLLRVIESGEYRGEVHAGTASRLERFHALVADLVGTVEKAAAPEVVLRVLERIGYMDHLKESEPVSWESRWENVEELAAAAQAFADSSDDPSLRAFLEEIALLSDVDRFEEETEKITLMTLHNAKGLEFPVVIITGLEEGLLPHSSSFDDPEELEEERRLFYVGLTRTARRAYLTSAQSRYRFGSLQHSPPSRFLGEIPEDVLAVHGLSHASARAALGTRALEGRRAAGGTRSLEGWESPEGIFSALVPPEMEHQRMPAPEDESQEPITFEVGMRVEHPRFGEGTIHRIEGSGTTTKLTILFRGVEAKKVLARYAKLRPIL